VTKKYLRESMTLAQFEEAWQHYSERLKKHVEEELLKEPIEEDVLDFPPPGYGPSPAEDESITGVAEEGQQADLSGPTSASDTYSDGIHVTPQQIAALKRLAQQVGEDALADVQDMLDHYSEGIPVGVYDDVKQRLRARKAAQKEEAAVER
jgi:hypothetical protein